MASRGAASGAAVAPDPLAPLEVLERIEVGPVALEADRLEMPYRVIGLDGSDETFELAYRWPEPVFDPVRPEDHNLGAMIGSQVALNYGLFAREIVFRGAFDRVDQVFLRRMIENTCREIYVHKFLHENPFLRGEAASLPAVKRSSYLRSALRFEASSPPAALATAPPSAKENPLPAGWPTLDPRRVAVLSSGGKDSLLSYGLLEELGLQVHPIFVSESGRHWMTAKNAHRWFEREVPETARVWTNCDRLFSWMLRRLPFVRPDFHNVRSDEYPIRLWTVAVFLFGVLPLARRRAISYLVIGDELDTSDLRTSHGIPHYNGLYDQSRWFDRALSRYSRQKGWGWSQFSLLRPLSEILIQKTLAERYPKLLALQVSCHATHSEDGRAWPCGRCEKCRRIVAMLLALGQDPGQCGYRSEQVEAILQALPGKGVSQERPALAELARRLCERGHLEEPRLAQVRGASHPEITRLRFHPQRSPMADLPVPLRRPLYEILLQHSEGAMTRQGGRWLDFDPLSSPDLEVPYPFDTARTVVGDRVEGGARSQGAAGTLWGELTWPEAKRRLRAVDVALLPVGAIEQHGPHLPLDTDSFDADYLARAVAERCSAPRPLVLPQIAYGVSYHHDDFPGTVSIRNETLAALVYDVGMSAARCGVRKLVILNGHGGNAPTLAFAAQQINRDAHIFTCVDSGETSDHDIYQLTETPNDVHAGEIETSTSLAVRPELVQMDRAKPAIPRFSSQYLDFTSDRGVDWFARTSKLSKSGVLGDPTRATREKGERIWELMIHHLVQLVEHLKRLELEEIYERRY